MDTVIESANIVTFILAFIGIFVVWSVITLFRYFFGGRNPLEWNTIARVEAAQNPANLMSAYNDYQNRRLMLTIGAIVFIIFLLVAFAPDQAAVIFAKLWEALVVIGKALLESARVFVARLQA